MSTFVDLGEKMEEVGREARGLISNLFGKKQRKTRDMIDHIREYLQSLHAHQQAQAALSPATQMQQLQISGGVSPGAQSVPHAISPGPVPTSSSPPLRAASPTNPHQHHMSLTIPSPVNGSVVLLQPSAGDTGSNSPQQQQASTPGTTQTPVTECPPSITSDLDQLVTLLYGDASGDASSGREPDARAAREVIDLMIEFDLLPQLLANIRSLEFEARKFFTRIFEFALTQRRDISVPYMLQRKYILLRLVHGYEEKDHSIALACDAILRACIQCEAIAELMLASGQGLQQPPQLGSGVSEDGSLSSQEDDECDVDMVLPFFRYLDLPSFINSHAFASFKLLLQLHPALGAAYLQRNYAVFFSHFNKLLASENYLTKVQSFAFLGEVLMERGNQVIMMRYVNEADHLKLAMMALRGPKAIQLAVFNVLKVFLPNPYKCDPILRILTQNKRNFLAFLDEFERDSDDEVLVAHKTEMAAALQELPDYVAPLAKRSAGSNEEAYAQVQQQQQQQQAAPQQYDAYEPTVQAGDDLP